jgi:hypothetical protein
MSNATREERTEGKVSLEMFKMGEFQKEGSKTAQVRQNIHTIAYYPSKKAGNSLMDGFFSNADFGYEEQSFESDDNRVAFYPVPTATTEEQFNALLLSHPQARIYRILSNHPILSVEQEYAINQGLKTKDEFAEKQAARYGEGSDKEGELIQHHGKPFYRVTNFSASGRLDIDLRNANIEDLYVSESIRNEWTGEYTRTETSELVAGTENLGTQGV